MNELYSTNHKNKEYFENFREDVLDVLMKFVETNPKTFEKALEIGCGNGATGLRLKEELGIKHYHGIELMEEVTVVARQNLDKADCEDIEKLIEAGDLDKYVEPEYEIMLFLDVLEHLYNPWKVLQELSNHLAPSGLVVGSIPNAGHFNMLHRLILNKFEYDPAGGLFDKTHIRFFTLHTIEKMLESAGLEMVAVKYKYKSPRLMPLPSRVVYYLSRLLRWKKLFVTQYLFIARKRKGN